MKTGAFGLMSAAGLLCAAFSLHAAPVAPTAHGRLLELRMAAPSIGDLNRSVRVYLPPSYDRPESRERRYPVIVLLHGWPGSNGNWPGSGHADDTMDSLIATGRIPEVIALYPSGSGEGHMGRSLWINSWDGRSRMEDFLRLDLLAWADSAFRTRRLARDRAVIGLSDGGTAAINLAFKYPHVYGAAGSHSGVFQLKRDWSSGPLLGPDSSAARVLAQNSPLAYVDRAAPGLTESTLYFDCGQDDEDSLPSNRALHEALDRLGVPHEYHEFPGDHSWDYWSDNLARSLVAVTRHMR
jgi:putative tributyrin esterase